MEKEKEELKYNKKGMTLISLVVTTVVMLILAGVSIGVFLGGNGLITMAQKAKQEYEDAAKKEQQQLAGIFERNYATYNGQLHVDGVMLMNEHNEEIRLKGTVLFNNSNLDFNKEKLETLKSWGTNVIKVGLGNKSSTNPYTNEQQMQKMYQIIDDAINLDMYVIVIFWSGNNLTDDIYNQANEYFTQITTRYKDVPNLIYEIANEPQQEWEDIKVYANNIISTIRNISTNSMILCPTKGHNGLTDVIDNKLDLKNILYVVHIYGGDENDCRSLSTAILNDIPTFVSEWSNSNGSANVSDEMDLKTNRFIALMNRYNVSSTFFIVCQSDNSRTFFVKKDCWDKTWDDNTLDSCGLFFKMFVTGNNVDYQYEVSDFTMRGYTRIHFIIASWLEKFNITKVITENNLKELPNNVVAAYDDSNGSGNIIIYIMDNTDGTYTICIASYGNKIYAPDIWRLFYNFTNVTMIDLSFLDTSNVTTMFDWFCNNSELIEIKGLNNFDTAKVTSIARMFSNCSKLENIDLTSFDFSNITEYSGMFSGIKSGANVYLKNEQDAKFIYNLKGNYTTINIYYGSDGKWTEYNE